MALVGVAVVAAAWFAVLLLDNHRINEAAASKGTIAAVAAALEGPLPQFDARIHRLRQAGFLDPDTTAQLDIAGAYEVRGGAANLNRALGTVQSVLRSEPENLGAWASLFSIQRARHDIAGEQVALAHARRLDPLDFSHS
jgi:cytochrome c-type biogenesis protein CcmH/NrfG